MICEFAQEQERRRKAEVAAHSALNGPRVRAYEFAGPDFEVRWVEASTGLDCDNNVVDGSAPIVTISAARIC